MPFERLAALAASFDLPMRLSDQAVRVELPDGLLSVTAQGAGCRLVLEAPDAARLAELREGVTHYLAEGLGAALEWQADRSPARPPNLTLARIEASTRLSPSFQRLRLAGDFRRFLDGGLHFRLIFGPEGADWPMDDETGATIWPGGIDAWHRPPYTVRRIDPAGAWIDVDVVLHQGGRVTDWVALCRPGDEVALTGPGGKAPQMAGWIGYIGDETALPVIARMLEILPADTRGAARIFVPDRRDAQALRCPAGVDLQWLVRGVDGGPADAVLGLTPPATDRYVFFAAERQEAAAARDHLVAQGFGRGEFHCANYWTAGWVPPACQVAALQRRVAPG